MRALWAIALSGVLFFALSGCTNTHAPPTGRWEGAVDLSDAMAAIRLEISSKGEIFLSAPDAIGVPPTADKATMRQQLAEELVAGWGSVEARPFDFDGHVFRKPGGIAPQLEWNPDTGRMTAVLYLGMRSALRVPLRPVSRFSPSPW